MANKEAGSVSVSRNRRSSKLKMKLVMKFTRLLIGAGSGILFIWAAACLVNIFRFHRLEWFFAHTQNFLYSGIVLVLLGGALRLILQRQRAS
jgi:hypothetical protein